MSKGWQIIDRKDYITKEHIKSAIRRLYSDREMVDIESKSFDEISNPKERLAKFLSVQMGLIDGSIEEVDGFSNIKSDKIKINVFSKDLTNFVKNETRRADSLSSERDSLGNIEEIKFWYTVVKNILGLQEERIR